MKRWSFVILVLLSAAATLWAAEIPVPAAPKRVALVFDDGPAPLQNERLRKVLAEADVKVTFSFVGKAVDAHPELAIATARAGHEINNHSATHAKLGELDDAQVAREARGGFDAIKRATGQAPRWFWSPYLEWNERLARVVKQATGLEHFPYLGYHFISTSDWNEAETDAAAIFRHAVTDVQDRTIILFHEWRPETVDQMPGIIAELRRQGFVFVTLSELQPPALSPPVAAEKAAKN